MSRRGKMASMGIIAACLVFLAWYLVAYGQGGGEADVAASYAPASDAGAAAEGAEAELSGQPEVGSETEAVAGREDGSGDRAPAPESVPAAVGPVKGGSRAPQAGAESSGEVPKVSGPRVQFDNDTFDFGTLYQRETVGHEFTFRNVGDSPLRIAKVVSTCACAATEPSKKELAAGESGTIKVEVRAGLLRGTLTKAVYVESNAVDEPRATLTITGEIKQEVEVKPLGVYIGRMAVGETMERTVMIRGVEAREFEILGVTAGDPSLQVEGPVRLAGDVARYEMTIRFGPVEKPGRVNLKVMVQTDLEHTPKIAIPVYGRVVEGE